MRRTRAALVGATVVAAVLVGGTAVGAPTSGASARGLAGPELTVPAEQLAASLACDGPLAGVDRDPILLVPGTTLTPDAAYSWNYARTLTGLGWRSCAVTLPLDATGDIQIAAEYLVHAIRTVSRESGRDVDILGYSQGGMAPRWALLFWSDTRALVDDLVGLSPSNHGTLVADAACAAACIPAYHQQATTSTFLRALNSGPETFRGIDYTAVWSTQDAVVVPGPGAESSSELRTGAGAITNIALQTICPANTADHFAVGTYDPVAAALVVDALGHDGPADASRIPAAVCGALHRPGVDDATVDGDLAAMIGYVSDPAGDADAVAAEPALRAYARVRA